MIEHIPHVRPRLKRPGWLAEIIQTLVFVVVVTVLFDMAIPRSLVDGRSMQPSFYDGERLVVSRVNYLITRPQRGDVIVLNSVESRDMLIKRVVGLPGETIELRDQQLYIDGMLADEPYIKEPCTVSTCTHHTWQLGADEYFVMGDNRNHSNDSRSFGPIPLNHIVGRVVFRYWPLTDFGWIHRIGILG